MALENSDVLTKLGGLSLHSSTILLINSMRLLVRYFGPFEKFKNSWFCLSDTLRIAPTPRGVSTPRRE
jgi:hypothetical protein